MLKRESSCLGVRVGMVLLLVIGTYLAYTAGSFFANPARGEIPGGAYQEAQTEGFDSCESYSNSAMNIWAEKSPFTYVGTYLGGRNTICETSREWITSQYASHGRVNGWDFLPLWVGKQPPCTGKYFEFSENLEKARSEAAEEVNLAVARAEKDGFSPHAVIYYDIEPWNTANEGCAAAFRAFMNVWSKRLQETYKFKAGVYGGDCAGGAAQLWGVSFPPDDVWLAHFWPKGTPNMESVYKVECVPKAHWEVHRFHQWDGFNSEEPSRGYREYGGVKLQVDTNCANGVDDGKYDDGVQTRCQN